jgi:excisionase family DNA binding protein
MTSWPLGSIRFWIAQGRLPAVKLGRAFRLRVDDLDAVVTKGLPPTRHG